MMTEYFSASSVRGNVHLLFPFRKAASGFSFPPGAIKLWPIICNVLPGAAWFLPSPGNSVVG